MTFQGGRPGGLPAPDPDPVMPGNGEDHQCAGRAPAGRGPAGTAGHHAGVTTARAAGTPVAAGPHARSG